MLMKRAAGNVQECGYVGIAERVIYASSLLTSKEDAGFGKYGQLSRNMRLAKAGGGGDFLHRLFPLRQNLKDSQADGFGEQLEACRQCRECGVRPR